MSNYNIIAWNVNSIRALIKKFKLNDFLKKKNINIFCIGETKLSHPDNDVQDLLKEKINGFRYRYYNTSTAKKGYSGTAIFSKKKPIEVMYGLGIEKLDTEGRLITLEFENFYLVHVYTPNSGEALARLNYRVNNWDNEFRKFIKKLNLKKPVILCGDLNCANEDIDIHSPKTNQRSAGFTNEERTSFKKLLKDTNLIDTFRYIYPDKISYSYWNYRTKSRSKNKGWRIDYFLASDNIIKKIKKSDILTEVLGSDHAPILLKLNM